MGMLHIWMISADAAEEVLKGNISYNKYAKSLYALARKCTLAEYRTKAIRKLGARWKRINYRDEKAGEYLEKLTEKGKTAHDRCLAATFCSREKEKEIIHRELAEACREKPEPEWVGWITDEDQLLQLFPLVDKDHKLAILFKASDCEKLCGLMEAEKDDDVLDSAARKLASDPMLLRKAMQTTANDSFVRAMLPRIKENNVSMLESLLETGEKRRVRSELLHRIRELSPQVFSEKYAGPYYGILKQEDQLFAIRENRIPQKEIFDTVRWPKWGGAGGVTAQRGRVSHP